MNGAICPAGMLEARTHSSSSIITGDIPLAHIHFLDTCLTRVIETLTNNLHWQSERLLGMAATYLYILKASFTSLDFFFSIHYRIKKILFLRCQLKTDSYNFPGNWDFFYLEWYISYPITAESLDVKKNKQRIFFQISAVKELSSTWCCVFSLNCAVQ